MFEHRSQRPISPSQFAQRLFRSGLVGVVLIALSLAGGTLGFMAFVKEPAIDAFLNAAMLLGGMGPIGDLSAGGAGGKLFAALFALYAGLVFLVVAGVMLAPLLHYVLHRFHWEADQEPAGE